MKALASSSDKDGKNLFNAMDRTSMVSAYVFLKDVRFSILKEGFDSPIGYTRRYFANHGKVSFFLTPAPLSPRKKK